MCDDYDTNVDSAEEEFEREHLIDDINKLQLALAGSDVEEEDEDEEENEDEEEDEEEESDNTDFIDMCFFKDHPSNITVINVQECAPHHQNTNIQEDLDVQPTLTELVPVTEDSISREGPVYRAKSQPVNNDLLPAKETSQEPVPNSWHGKGLETGDSVFTAGHEVPAIPSTYCISVDIPVSTVVCDELSNISVSHEQPHDDSAKTSQQQEINNGDDDEVFLELSLAQNRQYQIPSRSQRKQSHKARSKTKRIKRKQMEDNETEDSHVADYLDDRTGEQCMNRYMKACKPVQKGRWTQEENDSLVEAVRVVGKLNWKKVAEYVAGRTRTQCRERYMNVLNPTLKKGPWEKEEVEKLLQLVEKHGTSWSVIAKEFVNRSDNQCWRRWKALRKKEDLEIQDSPIKIPSRSQRKQSHKARSKTKRIKRKQIEDNETEDSHDENQGCQPTSTPSSATLGFMTPLGTMSNTSHMSTDGDGTGHMITAEESEQRVMGIPALSPEEVRKSTKRRISESSDEDWDETDVVIDIRELGNRMGTQRKRRPVNYAFDDDLGSDFSPYGEVEENEEDGDDSHVPWWNFLSSLFRA